MPAVTEILHIRRRRRDSIRRSPARRASRIALGFFALLGFTAALVAIGMTIGYASLIYNLPNPEILPALLEPPDGTLLQPTRLYDRSGEHLLLTLETPVARNKDYLYIDPEQSKLLPATLINATLAASDPAFWTHPGFSWQAVGQNTHPTLAQRLVVDLLLWNEPPSLRRDLRERLLAAQITSRYGREKVLEWYLNNANYGHLAYGADAAARTYLGKSASELNLAEAAVLAAVAEAPALNPADTPKAAHELKIKVLDAMLKSGLISPGQYNQATSETLRFSQAQEPAPNTAPAFTNLVLERLSHYINIDRLLRGGLQVITTLDYDLQRQAACTAAIQTKRIEGSEQGELLAADGSLCKAARLLPTFPISTLDPTTKLGTNVVVLDPTNGQVLAMIGEASPGLDPAKLPGHPPGSLMTPFVYLTAFSRGMSPATMLWDIPPEIADGMAEVSNPDGRFHGPVRLRVALANDYLIPAAKLLAQMGADQVRQTANQFGLMTLQNLDVGDPFRLIFEDSEVTLLDVSQAYGVLANQGVIAGQSFDTAENNEFSSHSHPLAVLQVQDDQGRILLDCTSELSACRTLRRPVISTQLAYLVNDVLSDETARWPSLSHPNPLEIGQQAGAKIGRTRAGKDAWAVGYTPKIVVSVWIGNTSPESSASISPTWVAGLWHAIIQYALRDSPSQEWPLPPGISRIQVCDPSGMLPTQDCPTIVNEVFPDGSEPIYTDPLYRRFQINRESGRQATIFTPADLIEERVYMVLPPEAQDWGKSSGLPTPPEAYDVLENLPGNISGIRISSPKMFASVSGKLPILGDATSEGFNFYRIQAGQGLNPKKWFQLSEDKTKPVKNGQIVHWDTSGLNGLYTLQLLVVDQDKTVKATTVQVTVDNQPPVVSIRFPAPGQKINLGDSSVITLQADASDDLELSRVDFLIDDGLVNSVNTPPFAMPWKGTPGKHAMKIRAFDRAGNLSEASLEFIVEP